MFGRNQQNSVKQLCVCYLLSCVQLFATPWDVVHQATLSMRYLQLKNKVFKKEGGGKK